MTNERDTQFQDFAHLVLMELIDNQSMALNWDKSFLEVEQIIARRVYDLAQFIISQAFEDEIKPKDILYKNGKPILMYPENLEEWFRECSNER